MARRRDLWALMILAVAVRAGAVLVLGSHHVPRSTYEHGEIAANLLAGRGFAVKFLGAEGPTSQQAPLYPFLLAGAYALGGVGTPRALLWLQLGQAVLGAVLVAGTYALARAVAPGRWWVAGGAAGIAALHPTLVYAATHVQVALLAATLLAWTLAWAYRAGRTGRPRDAALSGGLLGLLTLTDPILALAGLGVLAAIATGRVTGLSGGRAVRLGMVATGVALLVCLPWTVRNAFVHGEFVFVKSTFGYAFWQGNCALSEGTDKVVRPSVERVLSAGSDGSRSLRRLNAALWAARHEAGYLDDIALTAADYRDLARVSEPERSRRLFRRALADLRADPGRYPALCVRRLRYFVLFDDTNPKTRSLVYRAGHLGLTLLALLGLVVARADVRRRLGPTLLTALLLATFHTLTIVSARFHVPIEPLMGLWAAAGLSGLERSRPRESTALTGHVVGVGIERGLGALQAVASERA